jgi:guanylate kinase
MGKEKLIVISAPSGAGKTTIAHEILRMNVSLTFSVSATTRRKRDNETDGVDYCFITVEDFERRKQLGEFIECEEIYGDHYGSLKSEVERARSVGKSIVFDIDVKGALSIKKQYVQEAVLIFIKPPSIETLRNRLKKRGTEGKTDLEKRMKRVEMELELARYFDHVVVNDDLSKAIEEVNAIVQKAALGLQN